MNPDKKNLLADSQEKQFKPIIENPDITLVKKEKTVKPDFWRNYMKVYDLLNDSPSYQRLIHELVQNAGLKPGEHLLDAGCGTGNLISKINVSGIKYYGVDALPEALDLARQKKNSDIEIKISQQKLGDKLDFPSNFFDCIVTNNVFYILSEENRQNTLKEFKRILKSDGRLVISTLKKGFNPQKIYADSIGIIRRSNGAIAAIKKTVKTIVPAVKILRYNKKINQLHNSGAYRYYVLEELCGYLSKDGLNVESAKTVYSGQGLLVLCTIK